MLALLSRRSDHAVDHGVPLEAVRLDKVLTKAKLWTARGLVLDLKTSPLSNLSSNDRLTHPRLPKPTIKVSSNRADAVFALPLLEI